MMKATSRPSVYTALSRTVLRNAGSADELKKSNGVLWNILKSKKKHLIPIRYHLPSRFDNAIQRKLSIERMMLAISTLKNEEDLFYSSEFSNEPIPGPFVPDLKNTKELLKDHSLDVFNPD